MSDDPTTTAAGRLPKLSVIETHRHPTKAERERDKAVLERLLREYDDFSDPRPDLPTWLNGATSALLALRDLTDGR